MKALLEKLPFYNTLMLPYHFLQSLLAALKYHFPAKHLTVIAVTGTNGKTTTAFMIWQMLRSAGYEVGLMTTVAWGVDRLRPELGHMTTVDAFTLNKRISEIKRRGAEYLVLEVTSHALAQHRIFGIPINTAVFTNLTHDHLDYHKTFKKYRAAKGKLFKKAQFSILNVDDPSAEYYESLSKKYITYGIKFGEFRAENIKLTVNGVKYSLHDMKNNNKPDEKPSEPTLTDSPYPDLTIETKIPGEFNVYNSLAAALVGRHLKLTDYQVASGIKSLDSVEGRMNIVDEGQPFTVIVDYAHAPDALEKVFDSVKDHEGRIISVHGGAGRRDPSTRPIRGEILAQHSDLVIITEDDTRDEDLETIMNGFVEGAKKQGKTLGEDLYKIPNRKDAIEFALKNAQKGDLVLILGKGHEKTILRPDGPHDFEDIKVTTELLKRLKTEIG